MATILDEHKAAAIETIKAAGWEDCGANIPSRGALPGAERVRFHLSGTAHYATVGAGTTCFYQLLPSKRTSGPLNQSGMEVQRAVTILTRHLDQIRAKLELIAAEVSGKPGKR